MSNSDYDKMACEMCQKPFALEALTHMGDVWICENCSDEWDAEFKACLHEWSPLYVGGEPGQCCARCGGLVCDEDFESLGLTLPPERLSP